MTTRFYNETKLEGQYIDLPYGSYISSQLSVLPGSIMSINMPPHALVTLYSADAFLGVSFAIPNYGTKSLKVTGFCEDFPFVVASLTIDCSCTVNYMPSDVVYTITNGTFVRTGQTLVAYTFYSVTPAPLTNPLDPPSPFNPTILIIPDFGTDKSIYACFQEKLAYHRFSSLILDLKGVGMSASSTTVQYSEIIQDYRYIAQLLNQYVKKPILLGHGIGGAIAQLWSLTYKFELRKLILIGTAPYAIYTTYNLLNSIIDEWIAGTLTTDAFATSVVDATYNTHSDDCQIAKLKLDLYDSITAADETTLQLLFNQNPDIPSMALTPKFILTHTLILHGLLDECVSIAGGNSLAILIKHSRYIKFATGHSPQLANQARTIDAIIKFLLPRGGPFMGPIAHAPNQ